MTDYAAQKVPDLKKILSERGLVVSGNKADLVARLQEDDKKKSGDKPAAAEDEIDWDEDDTKATTAPAAAAVAAGGQGQVANPTVVPNQKVDVDPSTTSDLKVIPPKAAAEGASSSIKAAEPAAEAPKQDFSIGIEQTDAEKEIAKRAARAKKFGLPDDDEAKKLAERAKKFGLENTATVVKGLDSALPERRPKRVREEKQGGRNAKRPTPDRRTEPAPGPKPKAVAGPKKPTGGILNDPAEKAKAEARLKRFQTGS